MRCARRRHDNGRHPPDRHPAPLDGVQAKMHTLMRLQAESAAELDALLSAVLARAFRGGL